MKSIISFLAVSALLATSVATIAPSQCGKGYGPKDGSCQPCDPGYYNNQNLGTCQAAQPGWYACNAPNCRGNTDQTKCGAGYYSTGSGNYQCAVCPAGHICPSDTTTTPQACSAGEYMPTTGSGATACTPCPAGTYNDETGATGCCQCCPGTYNDQTHQTHCFSCSEHTNPHRDYSGYGATSVNQCQSSAIPGITNDPTCKDTHPTNVSAGQCPGIPASFPSAVVHKKRRSLKCAHGHKKCPLYSGVGGFDCVDVKNDPEQCGGCVAIDGITNSSTPGDEGQDCTAIPNVSIVNCVKGKCIVASCRKGFTKSSDGKSCESVTNLREQHNDNTKRNGNGRRWHVSHSEN
ncbi:hypothetical protein FRB90_000727 [Tulasnella sp. 427]|nr:hypothetical protein FRB90_000727 [Tulasnella sp. 427]